MHLAKSYCTLTNIHTRFTIAVSISSFDRIVCLDFLFYDFDKNSSMLWMQTNVSINFWFCRMWCAQKCMTTLIFTVWVIWTLKALPARQRSYYKIEKNLFLVRLTSKWATKVTNKLHLKLMVCYSFIDLSSDSYFFRHHFCWYHIKFEENMRNKNGLALWNVKSSILPDTKKRT